MTLSEWRLKMTDNVEATLKRIGLGADKTQMKMLNLQDKINKIDGSNLKKNLERSLGGVSNTLSSAGIGIPGLAGMGGSMLSVGIGAAVLATGKGVQMALDYEEALAKVNATAQLTGTAQGDMQNKITSIAKNNQSDLVETAISYEKILSQVNDVTKSYDILDATLKAAKAGFTDNITVADALARSYAAIGDKAVKISDISDKLFMAKNKGAGEFKDFATYIPGQIASGKNVGLDYGEVTSLFSYLTGVGHSAQDSDMLMSNFINQLGKPKVLAGIEKLGVKVFDLKGKFKPINEIVLQLTRQLSSLSNLELVNVFDSIGLQDTQAKEAFAALMTDSNKLKEIFEAVANAQGETNRQLDMTENKMRTVTSIGNSAKTFLSEFATDLLNIDKEGHMIDNWSWSEFFFGKKKGKEVYDYLNGPDKRREEVKQNRIGGYSGDALHESLGGISLKGLMTPKVTLEPYSLLVDNPSVKFTPPKVGETDDKDKKVIDTIHGGGTQTRNVYVNIGKVVDGGITVNAATVKEGMDKVEPVIAESLLKVINGAEQSLMTN